MTLYSGNQLAMIRLRARETLEAMNRECMTTESKNVKLVIGETGLEVRLKEGPELETVGGEYDAATTSMKRARDIDALLDAVEGPSGEYPAL